MFHFRICSFFFSFFQVSRNMLCVILKEIIVRVKLLLINLFLAKCTYRVKYETPRPKSTSIWIGRWAMKAALDSSHFSRLYSYYSVLTTVQNVLSYERSTVVERVCSTYNTRLWVGAPEVCVCVPVCTHTHACVCTPPHTHTPEFFLWICLYNQVTDHVKLLMLLLQLILSPAVTV